MGCEDRGPTRDVLAGLSVIGRKGMRESGARGSGLSGGDFSEAEKI